MKQEIILRFVCRPDRKPKKKAKKNKQESSITCKSFIKIYGIPVGNAISTNSTAIGVAIAFSIAAIAG